MKPFRQLNYNGISLYEQLLRESVAMAKHALASGVDVSGTVITAIIENCEQGNNQPSPKDVDTEISKNLSRIDSTQLALIHTKLSKTVAPATPRTILLLDNELAKQNPFGFLGPVPLIRRLMLAAALSLIAFIGLSLFPEVNETGGNILTSSGLTLLLNELFFIAAAGLGASFAALFEANRYIVRGTFDPKYESSYWIRFLLGIIAGIILAELIPIDISGGSLGALAKPSLSMLGGFSSAVVYRIIRRLVFAVESLVRGETRDIIEFKEQSVKERYAAKLAENRLKTVTNLTRLKQLVASNGQSKQLEEELDKLVDNLISNDTHGDVRMEKAGV